MFPTHTSMKIGYNLVWSHLDRPHRLPMTRGVNRPRRINQTFKSHQMNIKHQCHQKHQQHIKQVERDPHFSSNILNASSFFPKSNWIALSVRIHKEKQGYNAEKRRGEKEEKKAQKSSMEETGRCYLDQLPPPPKPNPRPTGKPSRLPPLIPVYCAGFTSLLYFLPSLSTFLKAPLIQAPFTL